ncbi:MAG: hypothetical protein EOT05_01215 [Candidatus Microsaccharimonas sossegonensis]|uniref:Phage tail lysozyme domain-containing protein n=1 Tax=Candidatus Microsaccharimonas sossegonensis TaxID=2506948 RepID=A0A4Q0AIB3_9BACT|nr:MAG: hypothetical protein EOT05_01215 [Candidatus Microsaccharimonas sossegonensis]
MKKISSFSLIIIGIVVLASSPVNVLALDTGLDTGFYSGNDILFYDPTATSCSSASSTAVGASSGVKLDQNDPKLKQIFTLLTGSGEFNAVQAAAIMGNMQAESGFNSGAKESNGIGYGLVQWSFGRRTKLEAAAKAQGVDVSDVAFQINYLVSEYKSSYKARLAPTAFGTGIDVSAATKAWMDKFEVPLNTPLSADLPKLQTRRIPAAMQIYGFFKDTVPVVTGATIGSSDCTSTNTIVASGIVKTALRLALPQPVKDGKAAKSDASVAYQTALDQYNPSAQASDSSGFIATVMISSGVDTSFPKVGVTEQLTYVNANPDKYKIITNPSLGDLQPGDILFSNTLGHATFYLGNNQSGYPAADASLGQRVPSLGTISNPTWMITNGAIVARYIGQTK